MKTLKNKTADAFDIESHIISCDVSYRGGTLKVDVSEAFPNITDGSKVNGADGALIMGAYQNYLGGGMAGAIVGAASFPPDKLTKKEAAIFYALKERIKRYFYQLNAGGGDEYMVENVNSYDKNQHLPASGY